MHKMTMLCVTRGNSFHWQHALLRLRCTMLTSVSCMLPQAEMEQAMTRAGLIYVPTKCLTGDGIRRIIGQYQAAVKAGKLSSSRMPGADASDEAWQQWVHGLQCTCCCVPVEKADIRMDAWAMLVSQVWADHSLRSFEPE